MTPSSRAIAPGWAPYSASAAAYSECEISSSAAIWSAARSALASKCGLPEGMSPRIACANSWARMQRRFTAPSVGSSRISRLWWTYPPRSPGCSCPWWSSSTAIPRVSASCSSSVSVIVVSFLRFRLAALSGVPEMCTSRGGLGFRTSLRNLIDGLIKSLRASLQPAQNLIG